MNTSSVTVSVKIVALSAVSTRLCVASGISYSAVISDINAELGKASVRDVEVKTGSTRYSKKADENVTSGQVSFKGVNEGDTMPLAFKRFDDSMKKLEKQFPSFELASFPEQFKGWLAGKTVPKAGKAPKAAKPEAKPEAAKLVEAIKA